MVFCFPDSFFESVFGPGSVFFLVKVDEFCFGKSCKSLIFRFFFFFSLDLPR